MSEKATDTAGASKPEPEDPGVKAGEAKLERGTVDNAEWIDAWKQNHTAFHEGAPNSMLVKHIDKMLNGRANTTVFFPLCGKALDMKLLYDMGHNVVGVEVAEQGVKEFFSENNLQYTVEKLTSAEGSLYKTPDGRIRIYCMDFYDFTSDIEGNFDGIWDRGGLVAINHEDRQKYVDLMVSLMGPDCRYLLHTFDYDPEKYSGPPHCLTEEVVRKLFERNCNVKKEDFEEMGPREDWNLEWFNQFIFLITK